MPEVVLGERHRHRLGVEEIADQDRGLVAPARVGALAAPPGRRFVDHVVMEQGGGVDVLDHRAERDHPVARVGEKAGGEKKQGGPDALAAGVAHVRGHVRNHLEVGEELVAEHPLDPDEVGFDQAENIGQGHPRRREGRGFHGGGGEQVQRSSARISSEEGRSHAQPRRPFVRPGRTIDSS